MNKKAGVKPIYKRLWVQVVAGLFVIGAIGNILDPSDQSSDSNFGEVSSAIQDSQDMQEEVETESSNDSKSSEGAVETQKAESTEKDASSKDALATDTEVEPSVVSTPRTTTLLATLISGLSVEKEVTDGYDRDLFKHWTDSDGDGCNTRYEVLIEESLTPVSVGSDCKLTGGTWVSAFDMTETKDPSTFDVDHFVPLKEAWGSGAWAWDSSTRQAFANDLGYEMSLIAVSASSNRSKSDRDPAEWMPTNRDYWCEYITAWVQVKTRWSLSMDLAEKSKIEEISEDCSGETLDFAPKASTVTAAPSPTKTSTPSPSPSTTSTPSPSPSPTASSTPSPTPTQTASGRCSVGQVDINSASWEDLQLIIHIGPVRADEIISMRSVRKFTSVDGLDAVDGIAAGRLRDIKAQNIACVN